MAYEIDFIGVSSEKAKKDADAICLRWKYKDSLNIDRFKVGVVDAGFEAYGDQLVEHMNRYYFDDPNGKLSPTRKSIDFIVVTHPHKDHILGVKKILDNFSVKKIYMNVPWNYIEELFDNVNDGRITKKSFEERLKEKYSDLAELENMAVKKGIPIYEAFQGTYIEDNLLILSPRKDFYLDLLIESDKTPLNEDSMKNSSYSIFGKFYESFKRYVLSLVESWNIELLRENVTTSADNETSVVIRGIVDGDGFLLVGDAGVRALNEAMDYMDLMGENIKEIVSFYQIPHHGGRHNVSPSVLDRMLGPRTKDDERGSAVASVAEGSDHPLKMVTNAYIRRGIKTYSTSGKTICHHMGDMPNRGWANVTEIGFSELVEEWDD